MAVILFYSPFNQRSRDTESLMIAFHKRGNKVISLSQAPGDVIHEFLRTRRIETYTKVINGKKNAWYFFRHLIYFTWFCWRHKVDIVYSHLESANFVASIGQYFVLAKVYICRHHSDMFFLSGKETSFSYKLTYRLSRRIIVVSEAAKRHMILHENVKESKIIVINLAYDFGLYPAISRSIVDKLKKEIDADLILITIGQLVPLKRPDLAIHVLKRIIDSGKRAKLIILGKGELEVSCRTLAKNLDISDAVLFPGYVNNVRDYIACSTFLLHPSISESSCVVVKEAAISDLPVIVCGNVGDFNDYIENYRNGFMTDSNNFVEEAVNVISRYHHDKEFLNKITNNLHEKVIDLFSVQNVITQYAKLNGHK
jgi:glycosyltransferase involved in cell wall biosynthesis